MGILVTFLTAALVSFTSTQNLSEGIQQEAAVLQASKAKLEEMRASDFPQLGANYSPGGTPGSTFSLIDQSGAAYGMGSIKLSDVYDDTTAIEPWLGAHDDQFGPGDNHIQAIGLPGATDYIQAVVFNDRLWVVGGWGAFGMGPTAQRVMSWEEGEPFWVPEITNPPWSGRINHEAVVFNSQIFVLGGEVAPGGSYFNDVWVSPDGQNWDADPGAPGDNPLTASAWPTGGRSGFAAVVFNNRLWVLGGLLAGANPTNQVYSSADGQTWTLVDTSGSVPMWSAAGGPGVICAAVFNNMLWVVIGNSVWNSPDGAEWTQVATSGFVPGGSAFFRGAFVFDGRLWLCCGSTGELWWTRNGQQWLMANSLVNNLGQCGYIAYAGKIYSLGGAAPNSPLVWWMYGPQRMYQADITVSWRQRNGRIVGADTDLDGVLDSGEDTDGNGILDSPVHITAILTNRGFPAQIYLGRE